MVAAPMILVLAGTIGADSNLGIVLPLESFAVLTISPDPKLLKAKHIREIKVDAPDVVELPQLLDPWIVVLSGKKSGKAVISLTDTGGAKETYDVIVAREVGAPLGVPLAWEWPGGKKVKTIAPAAGQDLKIARIQVDDQDARRIRINPVAEGRTFFTLSDGGGTSETVSLRIQKPNRMIAVGEKVAMQPFENWVVRLVQVSCTQNIAVEWTRGGTIMNVGTQSNASLLLIEKAEGASFSITGLKPGLAQVVLIGKDATREVIWIGVKPKP
jgi:hypothetical protein